MLGKGRFTPYTDAQFAAFADRNGWHPARLEAIATVESGSSGVFPDGRMKILPEPHKFYERLPKAKRAEALRQGLATRSYKETKASGHYKRMGPASARYSLLMRWIAYDATAAYEAISMGRFQIMGFNHAKCGVPSAKAMFDAFCDSKLAQLEAFARFLIGAGLKAAVRDGDYEKVEDIYNGGGIGSYSDRMEREEKRLRAGKWKGYKAGGMAKPVLADPVTVSDTLRKGDSGDAVEAMQMRLVEHGFPVQMDGLFGRLTAEAVREFQAANGLLVDGKVGPKTAAALARDPDADDEAAPPADTDRSTLVARAAIALLLAAGTGLAWLGNLPCMTIGVLCG